MKTHYDNLQVSRNASPKVIRAAYKSLAQEWHPDKHPEDRERSERILKIINKAYEVLSTPELRAQHDQWINQQSKPHAPNSYESGEPSPEAAKDARATGTYRTRDTKSDTARTQDSLAQEVNGPTLWIHILVWSIALLFIFGLLANK